MGVTVAGDFGSNQPTPEPPPGDTPVLRKLILTPASTMKVRRVRWIWQDRIAMGTLALISGREGLGKSTLAYAIAADITRGTLPGEDHGNPRSVLICAAEDSWEHTIVPRLIAAGADLEKIYRVEIEAYDGILQGLSLPRDFKAVEEAAGVVDAGLMILDPLMSVVDSRLDTHKDREVRQALEPLARLADRARMAIVGLIHHNKSGSTDALQLVMGSKAFSAVARSVHTCIPDPDDDTLNRKLFATSKNNLGRLDLPVLGFTITSHAVETEDDGTAWTGRINWTGEVAGDMHSIMNRAADPEKSATDEAADWLHDYLTEHGGEAAKTDVERAGRPAGHSPTVLRRARERMRLEHRSWGFPRQTLWALPGTVPPQSDAAAEAVDITEPRHENAPETDTPLPVASLQDPTGDATAQTGQKAHHPVASAKPVETDKRPVVPVASTDDATVTQLGLTSENAVSRAHTHTRAGGDDTTDMTDSLTPLPSHQTDSRASRVSRVKSPPAHARDPDHWTTNLDQLAAQPPSCTDCGHPLDSTNHEQTCEEPR